MASRKVAARKAAPKKTASKKTASKKAAPKKAATKPLDPKQQLETLVARLDPKLQALFGSVRSALRKRFPTADELVYDYSHSLVIAYSPNGQGIDSPISIATRDGGLRLYFNQGPKLPDPKKLLLGSSKQTRFVWIESPRTLLIPEVQAFLEATIEQSKIPFSPSGSGKLVIKTYSEK